MKTTDLVSGRMYAMRDSSYTPIKPVIVIDARRVERARDYSGGFSLWGPASTRASNITTKGILVWSVDQREANLVGLIRAGKAPEDHPYVQAELKKAMAFRDRIGSAKVAEFRLEFAKGEAPFQLDVVRPQALVGDYVETVKEENRRSDEKLRARQAVQKEARDMQESLREACLSITASLESLTGQAVSLASWQQVDGSKVRLPIQDLSTIAAALASITEKKQED